MAIKLSLRALFAILVAVTAKRFRSKAHMNTIPEWYNLWKIPAGKPGSLILDTTDRYGVLRGYKPSTAEDPRATGINAYVAELIKAGAQASK